MHEKKKYFKPEIKKIKLFTDEAVLTGCKADVSDNSGKNSKGCNFAGCKTTYGS